MVSHTHKNSALLPTLATTPRYGIVSYCSSLMQSAVRSSIAKRHMLVEFSLQSASSVILFRWQSIKWEN